MSENEMKILKRNSDADEWNTITSTGYEEEKSLQKIISENPDLLPVSEIHDGRPDIEIAVSELSLEGSGPSGYAGSSDIVAIDGAGNIYIIEAKLEDNVEVKRDVTAQAFDYASSLYDTDYEVFAGKIEDERDDIDDLEDYISDNYEDSESFRESVEENLKDGQFTLMIVVDEVNTNLEKILMFMNQKLEGIEIYAVAFQRFTEEDETEYLVPRLFGTSAIEGSNKKSDAVEWTYDKLSERYENDGLKRNLELLKWADQHSLFRPNVGTKPRFDILNQIVDGDKAVMKVKENGKINVRHGTEYSDKFADGQKDPFVEDLNELPIFDLDKNLKGWHRVSEAPIDDLDENDFEKLKSILKTHLVV